MSATDVYRFMGFTPTIHAKAAPSIAPTHSTLPAPYTALVIGASTGIGAATALAFAAAGASTVILAARNLPRLEAVAADAKALAKPGAHVAVYACDVASESSVAALADHVTAQHGGQLDAVVVAAADAEPWAADAVAMQPSALQRITATNYVGSFLAAHFLVPLLLARGGLFVALNSASATIVNGPPAGPAYNVSKVAQAKLVEHVAEEYGAKGLLAVSVHPGAVMTPLADRCVPEAFRAYATDDVGLCGAFCTWLARERASLGWLGGRLLSATWDVEELVARKEEIVRADYLKFRCAMPVGDGKEQALW